MALSRLRTVGFRNLCDGVFEPSPGLNVVSGRNAAGKTSLLEAVHVLARARSFRASRLEQVIRNGDSLLRVVGEVGEGGSTHRLGLERTRQGTRVRIDGSEVRNLSELAAFLPVQVINSESQRLLQDGPKVRRSFLNWSAFHVDPAYQSHWRRYDRALRQRNAAIRSQDARQARVWEPEMAQAGQELDAARRRLVGALGGPLGPILSEWLPGVDVKISYRAGWAREQSLEQALASGRGRELDAGYTLVGPHRADLAIRCNGVDSQHWLSRGQQKALVIGLLLAQVAYVSQVSRSLPLLLIDDLAAELDESRRTQVMEAVSRLRAQVFVTAIDPESVPVDSLQVARFHVEHGNVRKVI